MPSKTSISDRFAIDFSLLLVIRAIITAPHSRTHSQLFRSRPTCYLSRASNTIFCHRSTKTFEKPSFDENCEKAKTAYDCTLARTTAFHFDYMSRIKIISATTGGVLKRLEPLEYVDTTTITKTNEKQLPPPIRRTSISEGQWFERPLIYVSNKSIILSFCQRQALTKKLQDSLFIRITTWEPDCTSTRNYR